MSGESQRWLHDGTLPPASNSTDLPRFPLRRFDAGEISPPHAGRLSLAGVSDVELRRSLKLDGALEGRLRAVPLPASFEASLHALVDTLADDMAG